MITSHLMAWPLPVNAHTPAHPSLNDKMATILKAVTLSGGEGVTTRDISNDCDMSIYAARNWLLKLEEEGYIFHRDMGKRKTYWFLKK